MLPQERKTNYSTGFLAKAAFLTLAATAVCAATTITPFHFTSVNGSVTGADAGATAAGGIGGPGQDILSLSGQAILTYNGFNLDFSQPATLNMIWSGSYLGAQPAALPIAWNFSLSEISGNPPGQPITWQLTAGLNGGTQFDSGVQTFTPGRSTNPVTGSGSIGPFPGGASGTYSIQLSVTFQEQFAGDQLTVNVPPAATIDVGPAASSAVPEPASAVTAIAGLIALGVAGFRRRS